MYWRKKVCAILWCTMHKKIFIGQGIGAIARAAKHTHIPRPLFVTSVSAGFPSPADDFVEDKLDLNDLLITHPSATFFIRVDGDSMLGAGITSGDILIVDRARQSVDGNIIIAVLDGELTVKRMRIDGGRVVLMPESPDFPPIVVTPEMQFDVWGVVTSVIHQTV